jgi:hypothetical protein
MNKLYKRKIVADHTDKQELNKDLEHDFLLNTALDCNMKVVDCRTY